MPAATLEKGGLGGPHRIARTGTGIQFATMNSFRVDHKARVSKQIGVNYAICGANLGRVAKSEYEATLAGMKAGFASIGMEVAGVESHPVPAEKIKLRIEDATRRSKTTSRPSKRWATPASECCATTSWRGWAGTGRRWMPRARRRAVDRLDLGAAKAQGLTKWGEVPEEKVWQNISTSSRR
jgi:hypothetical protein